MLSRRNGKIMEYSKTKVPDKEDLVKLVQREVNQLLREAEERKARNTLAFLFKVGLISS